MKRPHRDLAGTPLGRELARLNAAIDDPALSDFPAARRYRIDELETWSAPLRGLKHPIAPSLSGRANPIVIGDVVLFASFAPGKLFAFDRLTGAKRWALTLGHYGHLPVPGPDGLVLAPTARMLRAVRVATGKVAWEFAPAAGPGEHMYSSPTTFEDRVYIGDREGYLYALDSASGKVVWRMLTSRAGNNQVNSTPLCDSGVVAVGTNAKFVAGYDPGTGRELWRRRVDGPCTCVTPAAGGELLAWTRHTAYRFRVADGAPRDRWHRRHHAIWSAAAAGDITLLVRHREWAAEPYLWPVSELVAYRGADELYRFSYPYGSAAFVRYEPSTGLVTETTYRGLGTLDPVTGVRRAVIADGDESHWLASLPAVTPGAMYLAIDPRAFGGGSPRVVALRHP